MKIPIFYFSGTGNTRYVAEYMAYVLTKQDQNAKAINIEDINMEQQDELIHQSDLMFLMYPIYGSDMPRNMKRFIDDMPEEFGKKLGVVCTQLLFSGDGGSIFFKTLKEKGYNQLWSYQINMPNNLTTSGPFKVKGYEYNEEHYLKHARNKVKKICKAVIRGRKRLGDHTPFHKVLGLMQRPFYRRFEAQMFTKHLDIDTSACTSCGLCARICPNDVIKASDSEVKFVNRDQCTFCLRCYNFCPVGAVTFKGRVNQERYKGPTKKMYQKMIKAD